MRRIFIVTLLVVLTLGLAPSALADSPTPTRTIWTFGPVEFPAGTKCNFDYQQLATFYENDFSYSNGTFRSTVRVHIVHTNLTTGYFIEDDDAYTTTATADGGFTDIGIWWHLRTPDGKIVLVNAGRFVAYPDGSISYTPNVNPDLAAVICPALGGSPA